MLVVAELLPYVHGERARTLAEAHALGSKTPAVAGLAEQLLLMLGAVRRVQQLVAHGCRRKKGGKE